MSTGAGPHHEAIRHYVQIRSLAEVSNAVVMRQVRAQRKLGQMLNDQGPLIR